jgi:formylglycine-generating enzyme required for sulfatase activity
MAFLSILLLLTSTVPLSEAQLDRLRESKALDSTAVAETPMVEIPAGEFAMGLDGMQALEDERPMHRVWVDRFSMDLHEVATAQYAEFLAATQRPAPWQWNGVDLAQPGDRPVIGVDWSDADAYCRWKGKRLPTETEWEKSARGLDGRLYPWGNQVPRKDLANFALGARFSYSQVLMPVQSYEKGKSPYGLLHMAGNGWECLGVGAGLVRCKLLRSFAGPKSARTRRGTVQSAPRWIVVRPAEILAHLWAFQAAAGNTQ